MKRLLFGCLSVLGMVATSWAAWENATPLTVSMTFPADNTRVWLAGSDHVVTCIASDTDKCKKANGIYDSPVADDLTIWWSGAGAWKDNDNLGASATYICTNVAESNTLSVSADDNKSSSAPADATANAALFEEAGVSDYHTLNVIIPSLDQIQYNGHIMSDVSVSGTPAVRVPEYTRDPARNAAVAFTKNLAQGYTAKTKFWHTTALTEDTTVEVFGRVETEGMNCWESAGGTFGTSWPSAEVSLLGGPFVDAVQKLTYDTSWEYMVPTGSLRYIRMTNQTGNVAYVVFDTPHVYGGAGHEEKQEVFELSCAWANGVTQTQGKVEVCQKILDGMASPTTSTPSGYQYNGTCQTDASNFARLVGVQGVAATLHRWATANDWASSQLPGDINWMKTRAGTSLINPVSGWPLDRVAWGNYHCWATAESNNWDASSHTKHPGGLGDYEDWLFNNGGNDDYGVRSGGSVANPEGQTTEQADPGYRMKHTSPSPNAFGAP